MYTKKSATIGIDIGGTKVASVLWNGREIIARIVEPTVKDNLPDFLQQLIGHIDFLRIEAKAHKAKIRSIGLGLPGVIDFRTQTFLKAPNLSIIDGVKVGRRIEKMSGIKTYMDNDARCFTRAEALVGAGKKFQNVFAVMVGTGIGGSWCINGKIYAGAHGSAGEIGVTVVDFDSGLQLENAYHKMMHNNPARVAERALDGNENAEEIFHRQGKFLGMAFANVANILDPDIIVFGGSLVKSAKLFFPIMCQTMKYYIESSATAKQVKVVKGKLGPLAGAIGAALLGEEGR